MSNKTEIIEQLFDARWSETELKLSNFLVTLREVQAAIRTYNENHPAKALSDANPANFFKDFIRNKRRANANWPETILRRRYAAHQLKGLCFEFVPFEEDQSDPFPVEMVPGPSEHTPQHRIESASLPLASRRLGRSDESWLQQVLVRLRVIETHLSLFSKRNIEQVDHLQMNIKQAKSEIDALYLAIEHQDEGKQVEIIVSCEAKGKRDDILEGQIASQVRAVFRMSGVRQSLVIPVAVKAFAKSKVHVIEFEAVQREEATSTLLLAVASEAVYELVPAVPGIGV